MLKWGSRGSPLAMTQSQTVAAKLARLTGEAEAPIESFITSGDRIADRRLQDAGGKGLFTKELDEALLDGRIDAMSADAPVTGYAIGLSHGSLEAAGETFDRVPYGWAVAKGSTLTESLQKALQHLIDTGAYRDIAKKWGMETWMVQRAMVDAAPR